LPPYLKSGKRKMYWNKTMLGNQVNIVLHTERDGKLVRYNGWGQMI
jgi:hypothetical protein